MDGAMSVCISLHPLVHSDTCTSIGMSIVMYVLLSLYWYMHHYTDMSITRLTYYICALV